MLELMRQLRWFAKRPRIGSAEQRMAYDSNLSGRTPPETQFFSIADLRRMCGRFSSFQARKENSDPFRIVGRQIVSRQLMLRSVGLVAGLDIYAEVVK